MSGLPTLPIKPLENSMSVIRKTLFFLTLPLFVAWSAFAQLVNNGQTITITQGTTVTTGTVQNGMGIIRNNGNLRVSGNWQNNGTYEPENGTLAFTGNQPQTVNHSGDARQNGQVYKLVIEGSGEKNITSNLTVTDELVLTDGLVSPAQNSIFLMSETSRITGGSENSYVSGRLVWEGRQERFYPVGNADGYAPVWLDAETGTTSDRLLRVGMLTLPANGNLRTDSSLSRVSSVRYWQKEALLGASEAPVRLSILQDEDLANLDSVVVAYRDDDGKIFRSIGQADTRTFNSFTTVKSFNAARAGFLAVGVLSSPDKSGLIYVPNAFAPAATHDEEKVFKIYGVNIDPQSLQLTVYNRWGNVVFSSTSFEQLTQRGWDGRNGTTQQDEVAGVYTYRLTGRLNTGKTFQRNGTVTLIR